MKILVNKIGNMDGVRAVFSHMLYVAMGYFSDRTDTEHFHHYKRLY